VKNDNKYKDYMGLEHLWWHYSLCL